ncbi:MAG TPA: FKBP-type peptidyl-prolyl cis-trans isomerase [Fimbriimonadaceae bacterium]|nr:FKBP-type peptidyl-prolyl cis-trans isomerase [Fimbriimonadaceae bacterium]HRJ96543.1 FKBP-type peptidyl-prolyl cis-trans isomerase [Fimbriimonadaceae bacterium]
MITFPLAVLVAATLAPLQSIDMRLGKGAVAQAGDTVTVMYRGSLQSDGKVFDETYEKGRSPFTFDLGAGQVIKGWDEGVKGMKVGGKRVLCIPPDLGYGDQSVGPIPAKSTLIFEIELLHVRKKGAPPMIEIEELAVGQGEGAKMGDKIEVHYTGTFLNGEKFDSSKDRGQPLAVEIGKTGLIKGFTDGLIGLKVGGRRKVTIPYELAYGEQGRGPIPPKATLVFELELVSLKSGG